MPETLKQLLIIAHTPSSNTREMAAALLEGAQTATIASTLSSPFDCDAEQVLGSDALILFTTENFGSMSGALKDFFERVYYPCREQVARNDAKPYSLVIRAGLDGTGTDIAVHKIVNGLRWKEVQPTLLCQGDYKPEFIQQCRDLGRTLALSLETGII